MLKKKHRLAKETDVKTAFAKGRSFFSPHFAVKFLKKPDAAVPRLTVVASTKVSKKAVVRNRLKRVARETVRKMLPDLKPGDYVLTIKPSATDLESKTFSAALQEFLNKLKLIK